VRLRPPLAWLLGLGALLAALFRDVVFRGRVFFERDIHLFWFGQVETFRRCVRAGSWPVWDPTISFGQPMLANPSVQVLYPWTWLGIVVNTWTFFTLYVLGHLLLAAIGFYRLGRWFGLGRTAAAMGAAVFITSGPTLSFVNLWHHLAGAALIPWAVWAACVALERPLGRATVRWGTIAGLQLLAGSADMCLLTAALVGAVVVGRLDWRRPLRRENRRRIAVIAGAALLALALGAGQWVPTIDVARRTARIGGLADSVRTFWSVHPRALLGMFAPLLMRELPYGLQGESAQPFIASIYLGIASLPLVAAAFGDARRRLASGCALTGLAALVVALGRHTLVYGALLWLLPPLGSLRYPSKATIVVAFAWAALAALGLDRLVAGDKTAWRRAAACGLGGAALVLAVAAGRAVPLSELARSRVAVGAGCAVLASGLLIVGARRNAGARIAILLGMVAVVDLFAAHQYLNPTIAASDVRRLPAIVQVILESPAPRRVLVFDYVDIVGKRYRRQENGGQDFELPADPRGRFYASWAYATAPMLRAWDIKGSFESDALGLYPGHLRWLITVFRLWEETPSFLKALQVGAVGHVVALHAEGLEGLTPEAVIEGPLRAPIRVFQVPDPRPRCWVAAPRVVVPGHAELAAFADPGFDPAREVLIPDARPAGASAPVQGTCQPVDLRPDRARLAVDLDHAGYVVMPDTHDSGWKASVDGRGTEIVRANIAFQAVAVAAGRHTVDLVYRPAAVILGAVVSLAGLLFVVGALVAAGLRRRSAVP
jgi:hypothetical protein